MKKVFSILLFLVLYSSTYLAEGKNLNQIPKGVAPNWPWHSLSWHHHRRLTVPIPMDGPPQPSPPGPGDKPSPSPILKCLKEVHIERGCYRQILDSFITHKLNLGPDCCKVVSEIDDDCVGTVFGRFNNYFFAKLLKKHCSDEGGH
ncbi:uncharacterized protein LOC126678994 [Mercurialis annua]|uniref:uncharacterized protein LOC126678994 n=1 Tax=Mercurialis annua TaxID=3986 RepID=UPI00215F29B4|nr:uncharacterized protein LOC126678994 [Mercurialis annua]